VTSINFISANKDRNKITILSSNTKELEQPYFFCFVIVLDQFS